MAGNLMIYSSLLVSIDEAFQIQEWSVSLSHSVEQLVQVEVAYAVPSTGFEFDPREEVGSKRAFRVGIYRTTGSGLPRLDEKLSESPKVEKVILLPMRVVGWTLLGGVGKESRAKVTFEEFRE